MCKIAPLPTIKWTIWCSVHSNSNWLLSISTFGHYRAALTTYVKVFYAMKYLKGYTLWLQQLFDQLTYIASVCLLCPCFQKKRWKGINPTSASCMCRYAETVHATLQVDYLHLGSELLHCPLVYALMWSIMQLCKDPCCVSETQITLQRWARMHNKINEPNHPGGRPQYMGANMQGGISEACFWVF